jgi:hypothetical protein
VPGGDYIPFPFSEEDAFFDLLNEPAPGAGVAAEAVGELPVPATGVAIAFWIAVSAVVGFGLGAAGYVLGLAG